MMRRVSVVLAAPRGDRKTADVPVWLVGTSAGTLSAANAAVRLKDGGANGLV